MTDDALNQLALQAKTDPSVHADLLEAVEPIVRRSCRKRFVVGMDAEDLMQEVRIRILGALKYFQPEKGGFRCLAKVAAQRHISTLISLSKCHSRNAMTSAMSIDAERGVDEGATISQMLADTDWSWQAYDLSKMLKEVFDSLSPLERAVMVCHARGMSLEESGELLMRAKLCKSGADVRRVVDNTLQRARGKLDSAISCPI